MRLSLCLFVTLMSAHSLSALRPPPLMQKVGCNLQRNVMHFDRINKMNRPGQLWLSEAKEQNLDPKEVARRFARMPIALFKFLTTPGHNAISWINRELPMLKFLWPEDNFRLKVFLLGSLAFMFVGKWVNVQVPFIMQSAIDAVSLIGKEKLIGDEGVSKVIPKFLLPLVQSLRTSTGQTSLSAVGALLLLFYGFAKAMSVVFAEVKTSLFAHVSQNVLRKFANQIFAHLHSLDSEFFSATPSGVISQAYARAVRGFQTMLFQIVFSITPTLIELVLVCSVLYRRLGGIFSAITLATFMTYLAFTVWITQWRVRVREKLVATDNDRNGFFVDSILNQETVKLYTQEVREGKRFDTYLKRMADYQIESTYAIAILNWGQAMLFCTGLTLSLLVALSRVMKGTMSVGDLIAVNASLLQLSIPFNFIGYTYQELRQSYVDMQFMNTVLTTSRSSVSDTNSHVDMNDLRPRNGDTGKWVPGSLEFRDVVFKYSGNHAKRDMNGNVVVDNVENIDRTTPVHSQGLKYNGDAEQDLLKGVSFKIEPGQNVAIVGPSGSGKSTTLKLMTRMIDPTEGSVLIDDIDARDVSLKSLRERIAVVPQDTCLFDDTILHNICYGNTNATPEQVDEAVRDTGLSATIAKFKDGLQTKVGERGNRLSGGERQRISIARALLKDPSIILCDEVTSAVDAFAERDITDALRLATEKRSTVTVAHRLSSIVHCDTIIVLEKGRVVQQGKHAELLQDPNSTYARMWAAQIGDVCNLIVPGADGASASSQFATPVPSSSSSHSPPYEHSEGTKENESEQESDRCEACGRSDADCIIEEVPSEMKLGGQITQGMDTMDGSMFG